MSWYLKGEVGKTLDATLRELSMLNINSCEVTFESLASDRLQWTAQTTDATGAGTIVPDVGQLVELWKDGVRKFRGHVLAPRVASKSITVTAEGPWWWMTRIPLTSNQVDGNGGTAERVNFVFPTGSHKTKVESLINRAIVNGVPMRLGTVDATFDTPNMSLAEQNCGQALAELLAWLPDAVAWFDHSDTSLDGTPILNISRRGTMSATTYSIGVDAVIDQDISPRLDLQVAHAKIDYVLRDAVTGKPSWATQTSGVLTQGKNQIVTVSGPEIVDFLPAEVSERIPVYFSSTNPGTMLENCSLELQKFKALYPTFSVSTGVTTDPYTPGSSNAARLITGRETYEYAGSGFAFGTLATTIPAGKTALMLGLDGRTTPPDWLLADAGLTRWFVRDYWILDTNSGTATPPFDGTRRADLVTALAPNVVMYSDAFGGAGFPSIARFVRLQRSDELPVYLVDTADLPASPHSGVFAAGTTAASVKLAAGASAVDSAYVGKTIFWITAGVRYGAVIATYSGGTKFATLKGGTVQTLKAPATGAAYTIAPEFVSKFAYSFLVPPAGLAAGLQAAQNWVPWEGPITLIADEVSADNLLAAKCNLVNTLPACATMATLAKRVSHNIFSGRTTIDLGAPARADFGTLTSRIRRQPRDNIVTL